MRALACRDQVRIAVRGPCCLVGSDLDSTVGRGRFDHTVEDFCGCLTQLIGGVDVAFPASFQWTLLHVRIRCIRLNDEGRVGFHYSSSPLDLQALHLAATEHAASTHGLLGTWRGHVIVKAGILEAEGVGRGVLIEVWFMAVIDATFHGVGSLRSHIVRSLICLEKL